MTHSRGTQTASTPAAMPGGGPCTSGLMVGGPVSRTVKSHAQHRSVIRGTGDTRMLVHMLDASLAIVLVGAVLALKVPWSRTKKENENVLHEVHQHNGTRTDPAPPR
jgi:hypothetical protein